MNPNASTLSYTASMLELTGKPHAFQGYAYGFHQPTLRYKLHREGCNPLNLADIDIFFLKELGVFCDFDLTGDEDDPIMKRLMHWPSALLNQANHPVFEPARLLKQEGNKPNHHTVIQPCMDHGAALSVVVFVIRLLKLAFQEKISGESLKEIKKTFSFFQKGLAVTGLQGYNPEIYFESGR
jgi:hypothetical protein